MINTTLTHSNKDNSTKPKYLQKNLAVNKASPPKESSLASVQALKSLPHSTKVAIVISSISTKKSIGCGFDDKKKTALISLIRSKKIACDLKLALETNKGTQQYCLKIFDQLDRQWQYRAMFCVWKSHDEPKIKDYGRIAIGKSVLCLLDIASIESQTKRVIDHIIEEIETSLDQEHSKKTTYTSQADPFILSFRRSDRIDALGIVDPLEEAIRNAETSSSEIDHEVVVRPIPKKRHFSRITNLNKDASKYSNPELSNAIIKIIDKDIIRHLCNPWSYLKEAFFPNEKHISEKQLNEAAKEALLIKGFVPLNFKVIEHPSLQGWVFKGNTSQISHIRNSAGDTGNNKFDHLNRIKMSEIMRTVVEDEQLLIAFPQTYLIDNGTNADDIEKRYIVVQEKIPILSHKENVAAFELMSPQQQQLYAEHLCRLILKTGYSDAHFGNISLCNGKLYIFDEEPMGLLVEEGDDQPSFDRSLDECAAIGLQRIVDTIGRELPLFRVVAENALIDLREKWLYCPRHRKQFYQLIASMQDPHATSQDKRILFEKLDPQLKQFLAFVTATAVGHLDGEKYGYTRILQQPEILNLISNSSGINILDQIEACFEIQSSIEILSTLKVALMQSNPAQKNLSEFKGQFNRLIEGKPFFEPLNRKMESIMQEVENQLSTASEKTKLKEFCFRMLRTNLRGSRHCLLDDLSNALNLLKRNNSLHAMRWRMERAYNPRYGSIVQDPTPAIATPKDLTRAQRFPSQPAAKLRVLMVAYECAAYGLKFGGLGEAVYGMAKGLEKQGHKVTILLPKFDKLPQSTQEQMKDVGAVSHSSSGRIKKDRVLGVEDQNISVRYLEDTPAERGDVDHYSILDPKQIYEDGPLADPEEKWVGLKKRMAYFSNAASEYIMAHEEDTDVAVFHDWHCAYAIHRIAYRYFEKWSQGKTPANVFVIHNNSYGCQGIYDGKAAKILPIYEDHRAGMNVMLDALTLADQIVTVSPNFASEIQQPVLGAGIDPWVRKIAHKDKLSGIINGSNPDLWNPEDNEVLKNWVDPITGEPLPLNFSSNDPDLIERKKRIKIQLQKALEVYYPDEVKNNRINVAGKDLILYVGRYDSSQKGLDKFQAIMHAANKSDAAFISMGIGEDTLASKILDDLEAEALLLGNVWITRGKEDGFSIKMQMGNKEKGIPGLGPLLRAAALYSVAPSSFEPCGLVQFESWLFGSLIIATATGGLADTIHTDPNDPAFNGFTFARLGKWESEAQNKLVHDTTLKAIHYWCSLGEEKQTEIMQRIMKEAKLSSWSSSPEGLSPIQQYERVLETAVDQSKFKRGIKPIDLIGSDEVLSITKDHHFGQGSQPKLYETYGAHLIRGGDKVLGVRFQVMAPGATLVRLVIKDGLEERLYPMENQGNGNWLVLSQDADKGTIYEYEIIDFQNRAVRKADPFAFASELRPKHASIVTDCNHFKWTDSQWLEYREVTANEEKPQNIYEVHLGSWRRNSNGYFKNYRELAHELGDYCKSMHYTHIELLGIFEHPSDDSWGYQISGFFSPTSRHGSLEDFQYLVNHLHEQKLGIIIDFVPFHFAPNEWGLREFSGINFFESLDPYNGETPGWGTRVFDLSREDVRNFLLSSAHFFLSNHIDGFRVDAVSNLISHFANSRKWMPNDEGTHWNIGGIEFMRSLNKMVHSQFPGVVTHAENSRGLPLTKIDTDPEQMDGFGFDRRWNMNWMQKALGLLRGNPTSRKREFIRLCQTFGDDWEMKHISSISHDEVVHGKGSLYRKAQGSKSEKLSQVRLHQSLQSLFPASGQLTFMGNEFAQDPEWDFNSELQWSAIEDAGHKGVLEMTRQINAFYINHPSLWNPGIALAGFELIKADPAQCLLSYRRKGASEKQLTIVHNFSNKPLMDYQILFPERKEMENLTKMKVVFNTDLSQFGGTGKIDTVKKARLIRNRLHLPKGFQIPLPAFSTIVLEEKHS